VDPRAGGVVRRFKHGAEVRCGGKEGNKGACHTVWPGYPPPPPPPPRPPTPPPTPPAPKPEGYLGCFHDHGKTTVFVPTVYIKTII
jgi:hypothetical protein